MSSVELKDRSNSEAVERQLREQVAAVTLLLNDNGVMNYSGHVSARLPGRDALLIQGFDVSRAALEPEELLVCDFDGNMLSGPAGQRPVAEVYLHSEILRARPDVNSVAHFHHDVTNVFTLVEDIQLKPIKNHAVRWADGIPVHADPSHVSDSELGRAIAKTLGSHHALQIRAHGQVITAESLPAVLIDSIHFVENGEAMYRAASLGKVVPLSDAEISGFLKEFRRDKHIDKLWKYYVGRGIASGVLSTDWQL